MWPWVPRSTVKVTWFFFTYSISPTSKMIRIDTKINFVSCLQPEIRKVMQKGVWPWFSRSCNKDRIFSLSPLDSLTPKTYPWEIFSKNSDGKAKIQGGLHQPPPLGRFRLAKYLGRLRVCAVCYPEILLKKIMLKWVILTVHNFAQKGLSLTVFWINNLLVPVKVVWRIATTMLLLAKVVFKSNQIK